MKVEPKPESPTDFKSPIISIPVEEYEPNSPNKSSDSPSPVLDMGKIEQAALEMFTNQTFEVKSPESTNKALKISVVSHISDISDKRQEEEKVVTPPATVQQPTSRLARPTTLANYKCKTTRNSDQSNNIKSRLDQLRKKK